ncbi:MAG: Serine/threonine protein kinase [Candidatus Collierbacteria bacterium GW2011_GWD2_45_10]|nr:MAG: Serine/threonine protein kinase [Candidatus Collierbacteria bacterium GW2011_GWA2_44_13]KKT61929.1 MAG: Serine/threonine protein kinase [Candidatus Collierbacteria bacterium GW2011_GWD1_44_27]KKT88090.1 MAG: Serine/threonine protein kinase [Candidatus Collierbacteria bacterium GW2011_GWD2_45_10]
MINLFIILFLIVGTFVAIQFAKGYRPNLENRSLSGTGLLSVSSYPKSARVIINDKLTTVTDDKLYLLPGTYTVKIEKDGFHPWVKTLPIKNELVTASDARLFPIITATSPLTFYQVKNSALNTDGTKIAYVLKDSPQEITNGLYIHSLSGNLLGSSNVQIAENTPKDYSQALLIWSPDSSQILAVFTEKDLPAGRQVPATKNSKQTERISATYLLSTKGMNSRVLSDVTLRLPLIISEWQDQFAKLNLPTLNLFPRYMIDLLTNNAVNVYFSPDKEKVFYTALLDTTLPENEIAKTLPNINSTQETRNLIKNQTYLFDLKEGTNYLLPFATKSSELTKELIVSVSATPSASLSIIRQLKAQTESRLTTNLSWYSNSRQLIVTNQDGVNMVDYDGNNMVNVTYVVPLDGFIATSPDGGKLVLLTNINQKPDTFNLITFDLK